MRGVLVKLTILALCCALQESLAFSNCALTFLPSSASAAKSTLPSRLSPVRTSLSGKAIPFRSSTFLTIVDGDGHGTAMRAGSTEPPSKGLIARIKGTALKAGGVILFGFLAYHVALGALKTVVFWICSGLLAVSAYFVWNFFEGGKKSRNNNVKL